MEKRYFVLVHRRTSDGSIVVSSQVYSPEQLFHANPCEFSCKGFEFVSVNEVILSL